MTGSESGPSKSLTSIAGVFIIVAVGGGGVLILLAGQPWIGSALVGASLIIGGLALTGRLSTRGQLGIGRIVIILSGVIFVVIALLFQAAIMPRALNAVWLLYLLVVLVLAAATVFLAVRDHRSSNSPQ